MKIIFTISFTCLLYANLSFAQTQPAWQLLGQLQTRSAKEIKASTWSIGGETLDRDYTDYHAYKKYLGPLGAKRIRLQGGWAKCEKEKGKYNFAWLDSIVNDALSQSVSPWIELSYGNPIYVGGGDAKLAGGIPTSAEALQAWDNWVRATVTHFKDRVVEWEIWNEPDISKTITGDNYADFYIRTAEIVRSVYPKSRLLAFGLAGVQRLEFVEPLFKKLQQQNKLHLVDVFTYHGYSPNPDNSYPAIEKLRQLVWKYKPDVVFMQGENGAPSTPKAITIGAMRDYDWSELTQAKWDLRRMMGDHGRGIATNLFTISDIHYAEGDHMVGVNSKGLLKTNPDKTIERPKMAYAAAQHVFSLFDNTVELQSKIKPQVNSDKISAFVYHKKGKSLLTVWNHEARPAEEFTPQPVQIKVEGSFQQPVYVDLITGKVYSIPTKNYKKTGTTYQFINIPVPDYPVVIADKSILQFK